ncbi:MAG: putative Ig domain-containing protein [Betaproteobacteria bacterium]
MLTIVGYAGDQFISLYRYYRQLTTPPGEPVRYSNAERQTLRSVNLPIPLLGVVTISNALLDIQLDADRGIARLDGSAGPVLAPGEPLTVTGHSLGGHLALLFARAFPAVAENVYTFNAPGITLAGQLLLQSAGLTLSNPLNVLNLVADAGLDVAAALGSRDGRTVRIFNEDGGLGSPIHNHSIVQLSDSLAMYELLASLSPALGSNLAEIKSILAAATPRAEASLETTLDMLSLAIADERIETPIARSQSDRSQRDEYYRALYSLRDRFADGADRGIRSLAGMQAGELLDAADANPAYLYALKHLLPFAVTNASHGEAFDTASFEWRRARADFTARMLEAGTADRLHGLSGEPFSFRYIDADNGEHLSVLSQSATEQARSLGSAALDQFLDDLAYDHVVSFGADTAADVLSGGAGDDEIFGEGGDDALSGAGGDDLLDGGPGDDVLTGGAGDDHLIAGGGFDTLLGGEGFDLYILVALPEDEDSDVSGVTDTNHRYVIRDADRAGEIRVGGTPLTGGMLDEDSGLFLSHDGVHTYEFSGDLAGSGRLVIDGVAEVEDFRNGDLGIILGEPDLPLPPFLDPNIYNPGRGHLHEDVLPEEGDDLAHNSSASGVIEGRGGNDALFGGTGDDTLIAGFASDDVDVPLPAIAEWHWFRQEALSGGDGEDVLFGSGRGDYLEGGAGSDTIRAGAGDDVVLGDGFFMDLEFGNRFNVHDDWEIADYLHLDVQVYHDRIGFNGVVPDFDDEAQSFSHDSPMAGDDWIDAGPGNDVVLAGSGDDTVFGGEGDDELRGGPGNDTLHGEGGFDRVYGEEGNDVLIGSEGGVFDGGEGDDRLSGDGELRGGAGADRIEPRDALVLLGNGDTLVFSHHTTARVEPDANHPVQARIEVAPGIAPEDVQVVVVEPGSWGFVAGGARLGFDGDLQEWTGINLAFSDGTAWGHADLTARAASFIEPIGVSPRYPTTGDDTFFATAGSDSLAGGAGDDAYFIRPGGHDSIANDDGADVVHLAGVLPDETVVVSRKQDVVLRYPGGELRLEGQLNSPRGVESVIFDRDGTVWDRAELASRAVPDDAEDPTLEVQTVDPGQAFAFTLPETLFEDAYTVGTPALEISTANGTPLPAWLQFDPSEGRLYGTPQGSDVGVVPVMVALRDAGAVVAVAPVVIAVGQIATPAEEAPPSAPDPVVTPPVLTPPVVTPPVVAAPAEAQVGEVPVEAPAAVATEAAAPAVIEAPLVELPTLRTTTATSTTPSAETFDAPLVVVADNRATIPVETSVGAIEDTTYLRIDTLLSGPASTHAPGFMERYSEAIQEFRRRQEEPSDSTPSEPPPTDEEMAMYNAALHAWLDRDAQRLASGVADAWDFGGMESGYFLAGAEGDPAPGLGGQGLARPSLGGAPALQRAPGLDEGLVKLGA